MAGRVKHEAGFTKQELQAVDVVKFVFECVVGVNREVGRDDTQFAVVLQVLVEEISKSATVAVVADARGEEFHGVTLVVCFGFPRSQVLLGNEKIMLLYIAGIVQVNCLLYKDSRTDYAMYICTI